MADIDKPDKPKKHTILVNDNRYQVEVDELTGSEIKGLDSVPAANTLFLEVPGPEPDRKIDDSETVELKSGLRFYDLPPIQRGDVLEDEIRLLESWYEDVGAESVTEGYWISVGVEVPDGWTAEKPRIGVIAPPDFPTNKPGGFWLTTPITLPNGGQIGAQRRQEERDWANICWQVQTWDPARDRLWRYFKAMERWFTEGWQ